MRQRYNILYNTRTGNLHLKKPQADEEESGERPKSPIHISGNRCRSISPVRIRDPNDVNIERVNSTYEINEKKQIPEINKINNNLQNLTYGIKKTCNSEFNFSNTSNTISDFKIVIQKNANRNSAPIYDSFYIYPNIKDLNLKTDVNIINDKKIDLFKNINEPNDIQSFPLDFIPTGNIIKLKNKLVIKNIYWNVFQSIKNDNFQENEILSIIPERNEFLYSSVMLQINFELHSQVPLSVQKQFSSILPYKNNSIKNPSPSNTCIFPVQKLIINNLNGQNDEEIIITIPTNFSLSNALLCVRISVPNESLSKLRGFDKNNNELYGAIPFSQLILNFDYEVL
jgi:hypothetical protein